MNEAATRAKRRRNRLLPLVVLALVSFIAGAWVAAGNPEKEAADRFVKAWTKQDFRAMHDELSSSSAAEHSVDEMRSAYLLAQRTATATAINPGDVSGPTDSAGRKIVTVSLAIRTRLFGVVSGLLQVPFEDGKIAWDPSLTFPGLQQGERIGRHLELSDRAAILARDGTPLAVGQGVDRSSPLGSEAIDVVGEVGHPDPAQAARLGAEGYPADTDVGISGLERAYNTRLAGVPGGQLLAVKGSSGGDVPAGTPSRILATAHAQPGEPVKTSVDPHLQEAAVSALAGRSGGVAVLDAKDGSVRALAGTAYSQPAPPGSTFKIITTVAALEADVVSLDDTFAVTDSVNVGGRAIENSNGEFCGGSFIEAFANSCNTVFAPLGPKIGQDQLVSTAEKFGFNEPPELFSKDATEAVDPPQPQIPTEIGDDLDLAVTAIGQGEVLATPLVMASAAQAIAAGGLRAPTPISTEPGLGPTAKPVRVTSTEIAQTLRRLMLNVVSFGTGQSAAISGVQVAGKTGTAELGPKPTSEQPEAIKNPKPLKPGEKPPKPLQILDAWFTAFAPANKPKIVVCVFLANAEGDGGEVAAPAAREIIQAAL